MFKKRAQTIFDEVRELLSSDDTANDDITLVLNEGGKPARGSFEIFVKKGDAEPVQVWSGKSKGPPRKDKFPEADAIIDDIKKVLK